MGHTASMQHLRRAQRHHRSGASVQRARKPCASRTRLQAKGSKHCTHTHTHTHTKTASSAGMLRAGHGLAI